MARNKQVQQQAQAQQEQPKQAKTKGALTPSAAVRLWNGDLVSRSMIVAEAEGMSVFNTEMQLSRKTRTVKVATKRRAEVKGGRVHPLDNPITVGTGSFGFDEALTAEEAAQRASKWLKRAASLDQLARQGDEEAAEKAKALREKARVICRAYGLQINKDGSVKSKTETAEPANETK